MNKPITVAREEIKSRLIQYINEAGMPAFVVKDVINELLPQLETNIKAEYEADMARYAEALEEAQRQEEEKAKDQDSKKKK